MSTATTASTASTTPPAPIDLEGAPRVDVGALSQPIAAVIPVGAGLFSRDMPVKRHNGRSYRLMNRVRVLEQKGAARTADEMNDTRELLYEVARLVTGATEEEILDLDAVQVGVIIGLAGADIEAIEALRAKVEARRVGEAAAASPSTTVADGGGGEGNAETTGPAPTAPPSSEG